MESHEPDLRDEIGDEAEVRRIQEDYRQADLGAATRALLDHASKLTLRPTEAARSDLDGLRAAGFPDEAILHAVQLIAYFNYINRVIDGLGADPEPDMRYGQDA